MRGKMAAGMNGTSCFRMDRAAGSPMLNCSTRFRLWPPRDGFACRGRGLERGHFTFNWTGNQTDYEVATITRQLQRRRGRAAFPFTAIDMLFADLKTAGRRLERSITAIRAASVSGEWWSSKSCSSRTAPV